MKNVFMIVTLLASVSAFAGGHKKFPKEARQAAKEACKAEGKTKKDLRSCVKEKLHATATTETPAAAQ
jgi:predicted small lipoprotein YifL